MERKEYVEQQARLKESKEKNELQLEKIYYVLMTIEIMKKINQQ